MNIYEIPQHIAIIPDGNRRWAKERDYDPWVGHDVGAQIIEDIAKKARDLGIHCMSFWGSSLENMEKRPIRERRELVKVYEKYFAKLIESDDIIDDDVQINVIGQWREQLPQSLVHTLEEGIEKTKHHKKHLLNFFLSYSGDVEMLDTIRDIAENFDDGSQITKETVKQYLSTHALPSVDYLIRTGGEPHLSTGFLMWDTANAQLFFSEKMFPDFDAQEFTLAVQEYARRARRLGV